MLRLLGVFFLTLAGSLADEPLRAADGVHDYVPGQVLVKYDRQARVAGKLIQSRQRLKGARLKRHIPRFDIEVWSLPPDVSVTAAVNRLQGQPGVLVVEPNYRRYPYAIREPNDPFYLSNQKERYTPIALPEAWATLTGSRQVRVAVIDDAVDVSHPDLVANIFNNPGEIPDNGRDDDNNGYVDDVNGWDFVGRDGDPSPGLCQSDPGYAEDHGTAVAGLLGATGNNALGIAGAAWQVSIVPLRIGCDYSVAAELAAFQYAVAQKVHIINTSYGGPQYSEIERQAIEQLRDTGILLVAAAGNTYVSNDMVADYPSSLALPNIVSVAASDGSGRLTSWSQWGSYSVDLAAPGVDLYVTLPGPIYRSLPGGTSFSAPLVSGVAALLKSASPQSDYHELKGALLASVDSLQDKGLTVTDGQVNAARALEMIQTPRPVLVIADVEVRDASPNGNGNGVIDAGETPSLEITLENYWRDAVDIEAELNVDSAAVAVLESSVGFVDLPPGGAVSRLFPLAVDTGFDHDDLQFSLNIRARNHPDLGDEQIYSYTRNFSLEKKSLAKVQVGEGVLRRFDQTKDEFHHFVFDAGDGGESLAFYLTNLDENAPRDGIRLLLAHERSPQFAYVEALWPEAKENGALANETLISTAIDTNTQRLVVSPTRAGLYHLTILSDPNSNKGSIGYRLEVKNWAKRDSAGCALTSARSPDIGLPLVLLLLYVLKRVVSPRKQTTA